MYPRETLWIIEEIQRKMYNHINETYEKRISKNTPINPELLNETRKVGEFLQFMKVTRKAFKEMIEHLNIEYTTEMENIFKKFFLELEKELYKE